METLPENVRNNFGLSYTEQDKKYFEHGTKVARFIEPKLPGMLRYGSNYLKANRRIRSLEPSGLLKK